MTKKQFDTDCVQLVLQGLLGRKVSTEEVIFFIESKKYGIVDYDEMWQRVWENFDTVEEIVDTLNYYEEVCLKYQKTISELKDGTYKEPLPITQRK